MILVNMKQIRVGITGGIGCGKSFVCKLLENRGYPVYSADSRAKYLMQYSPVISDALIQLLGADVYLPGGDLNRKYIGQQIFNNVHLLEKINGIVHPVVKSDFLVWCQQQSKHLVFKEAAIMFEANTVEQLDKVLLVYCPKFTRIKRIQQRDGLSIRDIELRMDQQWTDFHKRNLADFIIFNDGRQAVELQINIVLEELKNIQEYK